MATQAQVEAVADILWDRYYGYYDTDEKGTKALRSTPGSYGALEVAKEVLEVAETLELSRFRVQDVLITAWAVLEEWRRKLSDGAVVRTLEAKYCIESDYCDDVPPLVAAMERLNAAVMRAHEPVTYETVHEERA